MRSGSITIAAMIFMAPSLSGTLHAQTEKDNPVVVMKTSLGTIRLELFADKAPISTKNFLEYVDSKYYDGLVFHRVIADFMIQGGGFELVDKELRQKKTRDPIKNEASNGLKNDRGTIAMARTTDPDSATSQFFINVVDNKGLNRPSPDGHGYAVFGKVIEGMEVVDKIRQTRTGTKQLQALLPNGQHRAAPSRDVPLENVVIESVRRADAEQKNESSNKSSEDR